MLGNYVTTNFLEVGFVDYSEEVMDIYDLVCNGEEVPEFEYYNWDER